MNSPPRKRVRRDSPDEIGTAEDAEDDDDSEEYPLSPQYRSNC